MEAFTLARVGADVSSHIRREQGASQAAEKLIRNRKKCQGTTLVVP